MKIENKNGVTHISDFEIDKALKNLERGISLETFFKHEAERFEYGKEAYFEMLKREIESEYQHYNHDNWLYYCHAFDIDIEDVEKVINDLQKLNTPPPANQLETSLTPEQRRDVIDKPKIYNYNSKNENYIHDYLREIRTSFDLTKKITFGAICLALLENKIFKPTVKYNELVDKLARYWNIEPLKDKRPSHYRNEMNKLISKYEILERKII